MRGTRRPTVGIIGTGLIGGSIALACAAQQRPVLGYDKDSSIKDSFIRAGNGWCHDIGSLVRNSDIIVIAVPVNAIEAVMESILPHLREGQILTDVSSTKVSPMLSLAAAPANISVVGSHPMAGKAVGGWANADSNLFLGCTWVLCPQDGESVPTELTRFVNDMGVYQTIVCSPDEHDKAVASISHSVQISSTSLAAAVGTVIAEDDLPWVLSAGGWRDSTRLAESDPNVWVPILLENADNIEPVLKELEERLHSMRVAIAVKDEKSIRQLLEDGNSARSAWQNVKHASLAVPAI